jgi:uncharacterized protein (TIGR03083 family)
MSDTSTTAPTAAMWVTALRRSHERLAELVAPLDDAAVRGRSYDTEWSIADVASHLGSQAEIFGLILEAGLTGGPAPTGADFGPVWDVWNAKQPAEQVADSLTADAAFLDRLERLTESEREGFSVTAFDAERDLPTVLSMRHTEHAVHTWDIAVALDPTAVIAPDAVELLVDRLGPVAARSGRPSEVASPPLRVRTAEPARELVVAVAPEVSVSVAEGSAEADIEMPAESFVRLVYGRLDNDHTPGGIQGEERIPLLRHVFPGF